MKADRKSLLLTGMFLFAAWAVHAQKVSLDKKKNTIAIEGQTVLKYTKAV